MPQITVIVPVYRVEPYLRRCIDSILAQTFTDFELILVDDGSPDGSGAICEEYAARDSRILVIHQPNGGVSHARNVGIDYAQGDYIAFIDSDDRVHAEYLQSLLESILCEMSELSLCSHIRVENNETYQYNLLEIKKLVFENKSQENRIALFKMCEHKLLYCPYNKLFVRKIIQENNIRFNESMALGEDLIFVFDYLDYCATVSYIPKALYYYYQNSNSLVRSFDGDKLKNAIQLNEHVYDFFEKRGYLTESIIDHCTVRIFGEYYNAVMAVLRDFSTGFDRKRVLLGELLSYNIPDWVFDNICAQYYDKQNLKIVTSGSAKKMIGMYYSRPNNLLHHILKDDLYISIRSFLKH